MLKQIKLTDLAVRMQLTVAAAIYLPAAVTSASGKVDMDEDTFIAKMETIKELRDYVGSVCTKLAVSK